jgi:hypothetical protein
MKKHLQDESVPEDVYRVPDNIRALVDDIEARAKRTYPDHADSRERMVRQEVLNMLSVYAKTSGELGQAVNKQQTRIETLEKKLEDRPKPWWQFWS